jgi:hypothetical protein
MEEDMPIYDQGGILGENGVPANVDLENPEAPAGYVEQAMDFAGDFITPQGEV